MIESYYHSQRTYTATEYAESLRLRKCIGNLWYSKEWWDDVIAHEDAGERKARHELCQEGIIKGYRCHDVVPIPSATTTETKPGRSKQENFPYLPRATPVALSYWAFSLGVQFLFR